MSQDPKRLPLGPVMLDVAGYELSAEDREYLLHPLAGGVILFTKNYADLKQLCELTRQISALREPRLLLAVDHEGGRVQRFREGFTELPACRLLGKYYESMPQQAIELASQCGWLLAAELLAAGIDFSFAPVVDIDYSRSSVIGDRAWHHDPLVVTELAEHFIQGLEQAGMRAIGKHFPGHGWVAADSHNALPVDERSLQQIQASDLMPYKQLILRKCIAGIMAAHVIYEQVDVQPAGFSRYWLQTILRQSLGFQGVIFSDDLTMVGAQTAGDYPARAELALSAGCDMVLVCNQPEGVAAIFDKLAWQEDSKHSNALQSLYHRQAMSYLELKDDLRWQQAVRQIQQILAMLQ